MNDPKLYIKADFDEVRLGNRPVTVREWAFLFLQFKAVDWVMIDEGSRQLHVTVKFNRAVPVSRRPRALLALKKLADEYREMNFPIDIVMWENNMKEKKT